MALALVGRNEATGERVLCLLSFCLALITDFCFSTSDSQGALSLPLSEGSKRLEPFGGIILDLLEKFGDCLFDKVHPACALQEDSDLQFTIITHDQSLYPFTHIFKVVV